jgi:alanine dehydrogenase
VFARATLVAVDNLPGVQNLSREFITRYGKGDWSAVKPLSQLIAAGRKRSPGDDVSLFKAMGMGISDLALGTELVRRAKDRGVGRTLAQPKKAKPRLTRSKETT